MSHIPNFFINCISVYFWWGVPTLLIYPSLPMSHWQILENSSKYFPKINTFWLVTRTDFWKSQPIFVRRLNFLVISDDSSPKPILKNASIFGKFPGWVFQKSVFGATPFWTKLPYSLYGWVTRKSLSSCPRNWKIKVKKRLQFRYLEMFSTLILNP